MLWSEFKSMVDELLGVERRRLGVQPFIDRQIRLGVGDVQRLMDYYRGGIVTTFEFDDVQKDGFASRLQLPKGAALREIYHVRTGKLWARRPLYEYQFSNRNDLRAGVLNVGYSDPHFRYALDHRAGARDMWVYPRLTKGYSIQVVWDVLVGRSGVEFDDTDEVPFDEPVANLVYEWVKMKLAKEVDKDLQMAREYERTYRQQISSLYAEVQERLRLKLTESEAGCLPTCNDSVVAPCGTNNCGCTSFDPCATTTSCCPSITIPQTEWCMVGDSGMQSTIEDTISVATAIKALDPQFFVHLGDATYTTTGRPGPATSGSAVLLRDLFIKHYWNFWECRIYFAMGNHDLETDYGRPTLDALPNVEKLIGSTKLEDKKYWYTFAQGPVRFIILNSGLNDYDPYLFLDEQLAFVQETCAAATEPWIVVAFHKPAWTSDAAYRTGNTMMRTLTNQFRDLGVDLVVNGHAHNYERLQDDTGLMHVLCGLGGAAKRDESEDGPAPGSQFFYNEKNGFLRFTADEITLQWELRTVDNEVIDTVTLKKTDEVVCDGLDEPSYCSHCSTCYPAMYSNCCGLRSISQIYEGEGYPIHAPYNQNQGALWYSNNGYVYGWDIDAKTWVALNAGSSGGAALTGSADPTDTIPAVPGQLYVRVSETVRELWIKASGNDASGWELFTKTL